MTVNDSFECSDIHLVTNVPVPLRQLQVFFGLSFRCCTLACGENMAPSSGIFARECSIVTLCLAEMLWWLTADWLKYSGDWYPIGWSTRVTDSWLAEVLTRVIDSWLAAVLGWLTADWLKYSDDWHRHNSSTVCDKKDRSRCAVPVLPWQQNRHTHPFPTDLLHSTDHYLLRHNCRHHHHHCLQTTPSRPVASEFHVISSRDVVHQRNSL